MKQHFDHGREVRFAKIIAAGSHASAWATFEGSRLVRPFSSMNSAPVVSGGSKRGSISRQRRIGFVSQKNGAASPHRLCFGGLRSRTPGPPPFSSMNWIPPFSNAARIFCTVASRPPSSPSTDSKRAIVGSETPDADARSDWDQPNSARPAFICLTETTAPQPF